MRNSVIIGDLRGIEDEAIILGVNVRIVLPPPLSVADVPLGTSLMVPVRNINGELTALEFKLSPPGQGFIS
jgi:hypothetical protein